VRECNQFVQPLRSISQFRAECLDLGRLRLVLIIVAGNDRTRCRDQAGHSPDRTQEQYTTGKGHSDVNNDGVWPVSLCQSETFTDRLGRPHFVAIEPHRSRKPAGHACVVVNDEDTSCRRDSI